jgi:putative transcriptional regulator
MKRKNRIFYYRNKSGLTQQDIADAIGLSRQAYSAIELCKVYPKVNYAIKLARVLETTVEELFII